jgi:hypothetical protein
LKTGLYRPSFVWLFLNLSIAGCAIPRTPY